MANSKFIPPNTKTILIPLVALIIIVVLNYIVITEGVSRLSSQNKLINSNSDNEQILAEKEQELSVSTGTLSPYVRYARVALPERNPALLVITQIRKLAESNQVELDNLAINIGTGLPSEQLTKVGVTIEISGNHADVTNFIKETEKLAPLATVRVIDIKVTGEFAQANADMALDVYWAAFPSSLPAITSPIEKITQEDRSILSRLSELSQPEFSELDPNTPSARDNPFRF